MRRIVWLLSGIAVLAIGVAVYAVLEPEKVFGLDGKVIGESVASGVGAPGDGNCTRQVDGWWLCDVEDDPGSGASRSIGVADAPIAGQPMVVTFDGAGRRLSP